MRPHSAIAVLILFSLIPGASLPARAQHGGGHSGGGGGGHVSGFSSHASAPSGGFRGGSAPHAAPAFHGQFASRPPARFSGVPVYGRPGMAPGQRSGAYRLPFSSRPAITNYRNRPAYSDYRNGSDHYRLPYRGPGGERNHHPRNYAYWNSPYAIPFLYPYYPYDGWLDSGFGDDSSDNGYYDQTASNQPYPNDPNTLDDSSYGPPYADPSYPDPAQDPQNSISPAPYYRVPDAGQPPAYPSRRPEYQSPTAPASQASVTLIFKDGRPEEHIHNYLLSRTTLTVLDQGRHEIPVDQLDLAATEQANRASGVEFRLPAAN